MIFKKQIFEQTDEIVAKHQNLYEKSVDKVLDEEGDVRNLDEVSKKLVDVLIAAFKITRDKKHLKKAQEAVEFFDKEDEEQAAIRASLQFAIANSADDPKYRNQVVDEVRFLMPGEVKSLIKLFVEKEELKQARKITNKIDDPYLESVGSAIIAKKSGEETDWEKARKAADLIRGDMKIHAMINIAEYSGNPDDLQKARETVKKEMLCWSKAIRCIEIAKISNTEEDLALARKTSVSVCKTPNYEIKIMVLSSLAELSDADEDWDRLKQIADDEKTPMYFKEKVLEDIIHGDSKKGRKDNIVKILTKLEDKNKDVADFALDELSYLAANEKDFEQAIGYAERINLKGIKKRAFMFIIRALAEEKKFEQAKQIILKLQDDNNFVAEAAAIIAASSQTNTDIKQALSYNKKASNDSLRLSILRDIADSLK